MSRTSSLDAPADLKAEPGSETWARGVARALSCGVAQLDTDVESIQRWIQICAENAVWEILGYLSLDAFLIAEAGISQSLIDAIRLAKKGKTIGDIRNEIAAAKTKKAKQKRGRKPKGAINGDSINCEQGTTNENILRRLAREEKGQLLDAIESGEMSINAAAVEAGYRKKPSPAEQCVRAFRKSENRLEPLRVIVNELKDHERQVLLDWLNAS